jgi:microcystin-dependent protein
MSNYEATKYDFDASNLTGVEGIPTATIVPWTDSSVPSGFLECNGSAVSRTTYAALFAIVGTTYGVGDGSTTFNVPDLQDNLPIGKSGTKAVGSTGGANTVQATGNVTGSTANATLTSPQIASHSHSASSKSPGSPSNAEMPYSGFFANSGNLGGTGGGGGHSHNMSATFTGDSTSVIQPYLTLIYIIKT